MQNHTKKQISREKEYPLRTLSSSYYGHILSYSNNNGKIVVTYVSANSGGNHSLSVDWVLKEIALFFASGGWSVQIFGLDSIRNDAPL